MGEEGQSRQIKQMVAFILQEAEEKCKEIKIKVRRPSFSKKWVAAENWVNAMNALKVFSAFITMVY